MILPHGAQFLYYGCSALVNDVVAEPTGKHLTADVDKVIELLLLVVNLAPPRVCRHASPSPHRGDKEQCRTTVSPHHLLLLSHIFVEVVVPGVVV